MSMTPAYYNDNDPFCVEWLKNLIAADLIPSGEVDSRSIADVKPEDLNGFRQVHMFAGIGGFGLAARMAGWPDDHVLWTGGFPCFAAGSRVLTREGYKPIESVLIGDQVLTHKGRWRSVNAVMCKPYAPTVTVKGQGIPGIVTTSEHPFYARRDVGRKYLHRGPGGTHRLFSEPEWIPARDMAGKQASQILPPIDDTIEGSAAFWRLVGRYLADGWRVRRLSRPEGNGRVVICCAHEEREELLNMISDAGFSATECQERTVIKFHIVNSAFYRFTESFGYKADGKHIPGWVLGLDQVRAEALLSGLLSGDGYIDVNSEALTTVSRSLALSTALVVQRARGVVASIRLCKRPEKTVIEGRTVNQRDFYVVGIPPSNRSAVVEADIGWKLIRSVSAGDSQTVYNLGVEEDESYCVDGAVVHNCQPFSEAGEQKAENDERALWPELYRLLCHGRPRFFLGENVRGIIDLGLDRVLTDLETAGYASRTFRIGAFAVDAPHRRERVWICAATDTAGVGRGGRQDLAAWHVDYGTTTQRDQGTGRPALALQGVDSPWAGADVVVGPDQKKRRFAAGIPPLGDGLSGSMDERRARKEMIKAFGNAICPQVASVILSEWLRVMP